MTKMEMVATKVRDTCHEQDRSIVWLAERAGIAEKTLRRRLTAPDGFKLAELSAIASALDTDLESLVAA